MIRSKLTFSLAMIVVTAVCVAAQAGSINLTISYAGTVDSSFNPVSTDGGFPLHAQSAPHSGSPSATFVPGAVYHQFDVFATVTGLPGSGTTGTDLAGVTFDLVLGPGVTPGAAADASFAWFGNATTFNQSGPGNGAALWTTNADSGAQDLKLIVLDANTLNSFQGVHFRHPAEAEASGDANAGNEALTPPYYLGSAYVKWDGTFSSGKSFVGLAAPPSVLNNWNVVTGNTPSAQSTGMTFGPQSEWVSAPVPEPASLSLLGLAMVAGLGLIRRR